MTEKRKGRVLLENAEISSLSLGTESPDPSAQIDMVSTTQGLGLPAMTTAQRIAIADPRDGLVIYNTTTNQIQARINGAWAALATT